MQFAMFVQLDWSAARVCDFFTFLFAARCSWARWALQTRHGAFEALPGTGFGVERPKRTTRYPAPLFLQHFDAHVSFRARFGTFQVAK